MSDSFPEIQSAVPMLGFAAYSGTGKTTLLVQLLPLLKAQGLRVAIIKHAHHNFDVDKPGKDSYELRKAGATPMIISSSKRTVLMLDKETESEPQLDELIQYIDPEQVDLLLIEGFKQWPFAKIELHRPSTGKDLMFPEDKHIIALACDEQITTPDNLPLLDLNQPRQIADFILDYIKQK